MFADPFDPVFRLNRRAAMLASLGLLAWPHAGSAATSATASNPAGIWPRPLQVPGGIARLSLGPAAARPAAFAGEVPLLVVGDVIEWTALVGIALSAEPGPASISVNGPNGTQRQVPYTVAPKRYSEQQLKVSPRTVDLSPEDLARHERERARQQAVAATFSQPLPAALRMVVPVPGRRSS